MSDHGFSGFNAMFNKLLRQIEARDKKRTRRQRTLELGDTSAGRADAGGQSIESHIDASTGSHRGSYHAREYKQASGAVKGRGKLGGIAK